MDHADDLSIPDSVHGDVDILNRTQLELFRVETRSKDNSEYVRHRGLIDIKRQEKAGNERVGTRGELEISVEGCVKNRMIFGRKLHCALCT